MIENALSSTNSTKFGVENSFLVVWVAALSLKAGYLSQFPKYHTLMIAWGDCVTFLCYKIATHVLYVLSWSLFHATEYKPMFFAECFSHFS